LTWADAAYNGGSSVIDYQLSYKEASSSSWIVWASSLLVTNDIVTGLTQGFTYKFVVKSRNIINFSEYSSEVSIIAA